jgi:hypothetical protein
MKFFFAEALGTWKHELKDIAELQESSKVIYGF